MYIILYNEFRTTHTPIPKSQDYWFFYRVKMVAKWSLSGHWGLQSKPSVVRESARRHLFYHRATLILAKFNFDTDRFYIFALSSPTVW